MNEDPVIPLFDSHAHLEMARGDIRAPVERGFAAGLQGIVAVAGASTPGEFEIPLLLSREYERIWLAAGVHPHAAADASAAVLDKLEFFLDETKVVALGEIGLDYHYNFSRPGDQRRAFVRQLQIAHKHRLPVVIHTREADEDTLSILRDEGADLLGGVIHCFSSGLEMAVQTLDMGFYLSFSGIVTFPNADSVREAACFAPLERILAETDSPYLSPIPFRGRPNEPARVRHVVEKLAEIRKTDPVSMGQATADNARRCFGISR